MTFGSRSLLGRGLGGIWSRCPLYSEPLISLERSYDLGSGLGGIASGLGGDWEQIPSLF